MPDSLPSGDSASSVDSSPAVSSTSAASSAETLHQPEGGTPSSPGPVPYERFKEINDRYSALRWAERHRPDQVDAAMRLVQWIDTDPLGYHTDLTNHLTRHGVLKPSNGAQEGKARPAPNVIVPETGQRFYDADGANQLVQYEIDRALSERLGPLEETLKTVNTNQTLSQARAHAQAILSDAETWPHFKDHEDAILKELEGDKRLSLEGAYRRVVFPRLRQLEREAVVQEMNTKSDASTVNPRASAPGRSENLSKLPMKELFRREMAKRGGKL